ncbi:DDE-type integrase/transposase/recombinase [Nonomuraea sp. KC401]|uniref:Mu transposase C-terminal domain-containing protein n=1 Tax=unclassified Nonomuraea TaxID=2593643 RepID=UPI0010FD580F|nr:MULTISPECIES: Mu transposase C-terminal domain-containing protein [unclassified Nonomuraea]NBF00098.1 ISNCY family transposase [Nonomuraea sp. K271]TLF53944.1 DDE-type integrase/transposase/recombinase [Nonomuraea sp. KC401]
MTTEHIKVVASCLGKHPRTVRRYLEIACESGRCEGAQRARFEMTDELRGLYALWRGSASALHRELLQREADGGPPAPSLSTVQRAVNRDFSRGERAAFRFGEKALREHWVYFRRPPEHRNAVWEADHVEVPVKVEIEGKPRKPWVTWFIDAGTGVIPGLAVTPGYPSRESILIALRSALPCDDPDLPFGGIPARVRIDQGKDFLSKAVAGALAPLAVVVEDLPGYHGHLKGTVENLNGSAEKMFFRSLPCYTHEPKRLNGKPFEAGQTPLPFTEFVSRLRAWVHEWNFEHKADGCDRTPAQMWAEDPAPIHEVASEDLLMLTLEEEDRIRKITKKGIRRGRNRYYVADWMQGKVGLKVRLRVMPHHDREVEVFEAATKCWLGSAYLSDLASPEQIEDMQKARASERRRVNAAFKEGGRQRRARFGAVSKPEEPRRVDAVTASEARSVIKRAADDDMADLAIVAPCVDTDLPDEWVLPGTARAARRTRGGS